MKHSILALVWFSASSVACASPVGIGASYEEFAGAAGQPAASGGAPSASGGASAGGAPAAGGGPSAGGAPSGSGGSGGLAVDSGTPEPGCSEALKQIYVLTALGKPYLYTFDASTFSMKELGLVLCPGAPPVYSMAVRRDGTAWITATSGEIFTLDLATLKCTPKKYDPVSSGWYQLQIAFAADAPGAKTETLFAVDVPSGELGSIDPITLEVTKIGKLTPSLNLPRLTGSGDGKLFGMGFTSPIAEVNKADASIKVLKEVEELGSNGGGLGFAQLEGDLFVFRGAGDKTVRVGRFSTTQNAFVKIQDVPILTDALVAGAGVSTCAPFEPVK